MEKLTDVSAFLRAITAQVAIPNSRSGLSLTLECGHMVQSYGSLSNLDELGGKVLCTQCMMETNA